jgi:putative hydrolase of the HAD superfamily
MGLIAKRHGEPTLFKLERGQITEAEFLSGLEATLTEVLGRPVTLEAYGARLMSELRPNERLLDYYRTLRNERGIRLAILTNNVREWHDAWRSRLKVDELFELVVDSAFEGYRKPEPEIYALTLDRLGLRASDCAFVDDVEINVRAAGEAGMHAIHFRDTDQVIADLDALVV